MRIAELNGWRRLWIAFVAGWGLAVLAVSGTLLYDHAYTFDDAHQPTFCQRSDDSVIPKEIPKDLEAIVQKMIDAGEPEDKIATVIRQFVHPSPLKRLSACYPKASIISGGLASWFFPITLAYLLGAAVAWVRRGFLISKLR